MNCPFIIGERIYLRGLNEDDLKGNYIDWLNDPEVCQYNAHHRFPYGIDGARSFINSTYNTTSSIVLAIVLKDNDKHIGNLSLQSIDYVNRCAEFAILLGEKKEWGKGYSKEAAFLILKHGFIDLNLFRIHCGTAENNIPMQKLALYLGMIEEGRRRKAAYKSGIYYDVIEYGVLKEEFMKKFDL